jgi:hypothetical protein
MGAIDDGFEALLEPFYNGKKLTDPISTKEDKYQLLPAFLKVKGESTLRSCNRPAMAGSRGGRVTHYDSLT